MAAWQALHAPAAGQGQNSKVTRTQRQAGSDACGCKSVGWGAHQVLRRLCLPPALVCEPGHVAAALYPALRVPGALPVPHEHDPLGAGQRRQRQRRRVLPIVQLGVLVRALPAVLCSLWVCGRLLRALLVSSPWDVGVPAVSQRQLLLSGRLKQVKSACRPRSGWEPRLDRCGRAARSLGHQGRALAGMVRWRGRVGPAGQSSARGPVVPAQPLIEPRGRRWKRHPAQSMALTCT